jgi:hypothetical protein
MASSRLKAAAHLGDNRRTAKLRTIDLAAVSFNSTDRPLLLKG